MDDHSGHALAGQALVSDQAATRLAASRFDPSCEQIAAQGRAEFFHLRGGPTPCPWCDSQDHWSGRIEGCPARSSRLVTRAIAALVEKDEGWQAYAMRLRKLLNDEVERVA